MGDIADDLIQDGIDAMIEDGASLREISDVFNISHKRRRINKKMKRQFFIAGVQFRPKNEISYAAKEIEVGTKLILKPEPTNKFDPNAVQVLCHLIDTDGSELDVFLGYVPKKFSSEVSAMLGIGAPVQCVVDEVNPSAKTYEMFKVTVSIPIEEEEEAENDNHFDNMEE
jgi:hypothetical protein